MTPTPGGPVEALIAEWREKAGNWRWHSFMRSTLLNCADELEAALAAVRVPEEPEKALSVAGTLREIIDKGKGQPIGRLLWRLQVCLERLALPVPPAEPGRPDVDRLVAQAREISILLAEAGVGSGTLVEGVRALIARPSEPGREQTNEQLAFERLSLALTGGNAATWDELFHVAEERALPPPLQPAEPGRESGDKDEYEHWRNMAADTVHHFWFTNREAGVLLAHIDRLKAEVERLRAVAPEGREP